MRSGDWNCGVLESHTRSVSNPVRFGDNGISVLSLVLPWPSQSRTPGSIWSVMDLKGAPSWIPGSRSFILSLGAALVSFLQSEGYFSCGHRRPDRARRQSGSQRSRAASPGLPAG